MALLNIPSDAEASPEQAVLFKHATTLLGRTANAVRVASHSPKLAQSILGFIVAAHNKNALDLSNADNMINLYWILI